MEKQNPDHSFVFEDQYGWSYFKIYTSAYEALLEHLDLVGVVWSPKIKLVLNKKETVENVALYHFEVYFNGC